MLSSLLTAEQQYTCRLSYAFFVTDSWTPVHPQMFACFLCYQQLNSSASADFHMFSLLSTAEHQWNCLPGEESAWAWRWPFTVPRLRMSGVILLFPLYAFMVWTGTTYFWVTLCLSKTTKHNMRKWENYTGRYSSFPWGFSTILTSVIADNYNEIVWTVHCDIPV